MKKVKIIAMLVIGMTLGATIQAGGWQQACFDAYNACMEDAAAGTVSPRKCDRILRTCLDNR